MKIIVRKLKNEPRRPRQYWEGTSWSARRHRALPLDGDILTESLDGLRRAFGEESEISFEEVTRGDETKGCLCESCKETRRGRIPANEK